jgi:hypothetical protein
MLTHPCYVVGYTGQRRTKPQCKDHHNQDQDPPLETNVFFTLFSKHVRHRRKILDCLGLPIRAPSERYPYPSSHHRGGAHRGYPDFQAIAKDIFKTMLQIANRRVLIAKPWAHFCSNVLASSAQRSNHQSP